MNAKNIKGHILLLFANVAWGVNAPICKSILSSTDNPSGVSASALSAYRMVGAALLFWIVSLFLKSEKVSRGDLGKLFLASLFGIQLNQFLYLWGLSLTSPIDASVIATIVPILTMLFAMIFLGEPITWLKFGGVALGAAGAIWLVVGGNVSSGGTPSSLFGNTLCIISATSYAVYLTAFKRVITKYSPVTTARWLFLFSGIVAVALYHKPLMAVDYSTLPLSTYGGISFVIVMATVGAYICSIIALRFIRPTLVSMYNYVQPVVTVIISVAIGMSVFGATKALATLAIFTGVWMVTISKAKRQDEKEVQ